MRCQNCHALLSTEDLRGDDCPYCGMALPHSADAVAKARVARELMGTVDKDGDGVPDFLPNVARARGAVKGVIIGTVVLTFLIGAGTIAAVYGSGGDVVSSGGAGADVVLIVDSCPIDANGDGVDDYATVVQRSGAARRWGILDGVTGEIIALGSRDVEDLNRVFCLENGWFVTGAPARTRRPLR